MANCGYHTEDAVLNFLPKFHACEILTHIHSVSISLPTKLISMYDSRFIDDSVVDVVVPQQSDYEVEDIITSTNAIEPEESGVLPQIPQRSLLYFGKPKGDIPLNLRSYSFTGT